MKNIGKIIFIGLCGLVGALLSVTLLPPQIDAIGQRMYSMNRKLEQESGPGQSNVSPPAKTPEKPDAQTPAPPADPSAPVVGDLSEGEAAGSSTSPSANASAPVVGNETQSKPPFRPVADDTSIQPQFQANAFALALLGFILGSALGSFLVRVGDRAGANWDKMPPGDRIIWVLGTFSGVVAGIIVSVPFLLLFQGRPEGTLISIALVVGCSAAMVYLLRSLAPYLPWESSAMTQRRTGIKILDTNVLIDGRVYDLIRTGFIDGDIYIPGFVLLELQHIADSSDSLRRQRGRRGLDVLKRIQSEFTVDVGSRDRYAGNQKEEVDARLVKLAKSLGADLVSNDFNLNRVATIQDVKVLNINDLALALRPNVLPGENLDVMIIREGNQSNQGVGYLDDGTMVVVEHGRDLIGEATTVVVTQVIQTERGKMIFADADLDIAIEEPRRKQPPSRGTR
ncbi:MAG: hypothetical protein LCH41_14885 [Armatimonadetes bacterium]|nr:hypothetical protein [Armatimonadota bacterium]